MDAREIRRELEGLVRGKTTRVPQATRERVLAYARQERGRGQSWDAIAQALGLSSSGLQRWWKADAGSTRLRRVKLVAAAAPAGAVAVVSPRGYRIEGLSLDQAMSVLVRLA